MAPKPRRRWVSSTPGFNPSITQKVHTALIEAGHDELLDQIYTDAFAELEERLHHIEKDVMILKEAERERLTKSGVWSVVEGRLNAKAVKWTTWALRGAIVGLGATAIEVIKWLASRWLT